MSKPPAPEQKSVEEILASIRRIMGDSDLLDEPPRPLATPPPAAPPPAAPPPAAPPARGEDPDADVLLLTQAVAEAGTVLTVAPGEGAA